MPAVRTHPGIRRRILVAFVLMTVLPAAALSYLGMRAVGRVIEGRLVRERAANAARVFSEMKLPFTPLMMQRLSEMFGEQEGEVAAELNSDAIGEALVSSLSQAEERDLQAQLHERATAPQTVRLAGREFVLAPAEVRDAQNRPHTLYLMVDRRVLDDAKAAAVRPILLGAIPVLLAVIAAAVYVSRTITAPIRRLSAQMESQMPTADSVALHDVELHAPKELADLAATFNRMLGRLRETQQRLLETERLAAVGKIAASVAHEVRNPLSGIRMNLQLLQQHLAREGRTDESLTIALTELERLDAIVQEMLVLGRKSEPKFERVDLREIAGDVLHLLERRLAHAAVTPTLEGASAPATADPAQIKQVLLNLILNATDAMPQGGRLTVRTTGHDGVARVEIEDTGPGVTLENGQDPFAWFSTSKSAGSGIGLAVCRQIVEAHGGRIGLERIEGGTRAWVQLKHQGPSSKFQTNFNDQ
ncbi:MAG TPA: ATP-binding protein [Tepidisphaeraceae bacterium]|jgi:signal transduction histidine kinase